MNHKSPNLNLERNLSLATNLVPALGYDKSAWIAKQAAKTDQTVREVARENKLLSEEELDSCWGFKKDSIYPRITQMNTDQVFDKT